MEDTFEGHMWEGLLTQFVFKCLYALPINKTTFAPVLVNKRWRRYFRHPLQVFQEGEFDCNVMQFPPSYYFNPCTFTLYHQLIRSVGMSRQISRIPKDAGKDREEFILNEMWLHCFVVIDFCQNQVIDSILQKLKLKRITLHFPGYSKVLEFFDQENLVKVYKFSPHLQIFKRLLEDQNFILSCVKTYGMNLQLLRQDLITEEICKIAVSYEGRALEWVPQRLQTEEICKLAVMNVGYALRFVPLQFQTEEVCTLAVQNTGYALIYVPISLRTEELIRLAICNNGNALSLIPAPLRTEELCDLAVSQSGRAIEAVPIHLRSEELYRLAVQSEGALEKIPIKFRTEELCKVAVKSDSCSLKYCPKKTYELCKIAVQQGNGAMVGSSFQFIPIHLRSEEIYKIALQKSGYVLELIPRKKRTEELCTYAVQQQFDRSWTKEAYLKFVPQRCKTEEICTLAVESDVVSILFVPRGLRRVVSSKALLQ